MTDAEKKASYHEIKDYVLEHRGLKVSSLNIAQIKQKSDDTRQPNRPPNKEKAINKALKHFGIK